MVFIRFYNRFYGSNEMCNLYFDYKRVIYIVLKKGYCYDILKQYVIEMVEQILREEFSYRVIVCIILRQFSFIQFDLRFFNIVVLEFIIFFDF